MRQILHAPRPQPRLTVGAPNDAFEQEADRVANHVMRMPDPSVQRKCAACAAEEDETIRAKAEPGERASVPAGFESRFSALHGGGQPLPASERSFFEPRFGRDFSSVRVHHGPAAGELARSVNARAFTLGSSVVFGDGEYAPGSTTGRSLLAHELTHVVQQGGGRASNSVQRREFSDCSGSLRIPVHGSASVPASPGAPEVGKAYSDGFTGRRGTTVTITATASFSGSGTSGDFSVTLRQCGRVWDSDVGAREVGSIGGAALTFSRTLPGSGMFMDTDNYYLYFRNSATRGAIDVDYSVT